MTENLEIFKCEICGNIVEVLHEAGGTLVCCGEPMTLVEENTMDASKEKHVPVIKGKKVFIGSVPHPMEDSHFIEWIEVISIEGEVSKVFLKPGDKPEAEFCFKVASAREYCNLHGLWKG